MNKLNQIGDTIVEVMVVLAVLGLAVSISYATANRSLLSARQAQESSQATALLQSQVEALRYLQPYGPTAPAAHNIFVASPSYFCITSSNTVSTTFSDNTNLLSPGTLGTNYPTACNNGIYYISIQYGGTPNDVFTVKAYWYDVAGQGIDSATLNYGLHQP